MNRNIGNSNQFLNLAFNQVNKSLTKIILSMLPSIGIFPRAWWHTAPTTVPRQCTKIWKK